MQNMKGVKVLVLIMLISLVAFVPEAKAVDLEQLMSQQKTVLELYESQQISEDTCAIFAAAVEIYLAYEEGVFAGAEIAPLVADSLHLEKYTWQKRGDIAGKALSLFETLNQNYYTIKNILEKSELWSPNKQELEILLLARQLLDHVRERPDSHVTELGKVWEDIANSYREEKFEAMPSNQEFPRLESLDEKEAAKTFVTYARWIAVNYKWLLIAQEHYRETKWAFLEGEGLLANWNDYSQKREQGFSWELLTLFLGLALCIPGIWLGHRRSKKAP